MKFIRNFAVTNESFGTLRRTAHNIRHSAMKRDLSFAGTGISHVIISALALGSVLLSCSKDRGPSAGGLTGGESTFNVTLNAGSFAGTPIEGGELDEAEELSKVIPATGMHEDDMANIWVLQFNTGGSCVRSTYYPAYNPDNFPVTLSNGTAQTVAFVANTFDANLFKDYAGTWSAFQSLTKNVAEATVHTGSGAADRYLIISGIYKGDITTTGIQTAVQMKRAVAKVRFTWSLELPAGETFASKSMQICKAATKQAYMEQSAALYPAGAAGNFAAYEDLDIPDEGTYTWYVAENVRGTGTGSTSFDKTELTAPSGQGQYCTYIDLQGEYTFADGRKADLSYKFYLGANVTTDYNVRRNNIYDMTVRITGANAADTRITITSADGTWGVDTDNPNNVNGGATFN